MKCSRTRILLSALMVLALAGCAKQEDPYAQVAPIIAKHCVSCHSAHPKDARFEVPPVGVAFDSPDSVKRRAVRIKALTVTTTVMPLGNETAMTAAERQVLGRWIDAGAPISGR